ncbi:MAG TPA: hypothetical protein VLX91_00600 [Candidatus Acidoferrales bacterium]|nr:hypothetical protein [Candidatus Acidoferrales bacterium]
MNSSTRLLLAQISFDLPFYFIFLFAFSSVGLAYLMYRKVHEIAKPKQAFLFTLRSISFFLLFLVLANLTVDIVKAYTKKRDIFVLLDDSKSMSLYDGTVRRSQVERNLLQSERFQDLSKGFDIVPVIFGGEVLKLNSLDSLKFDQPLTNVESALVEASRLGTNAQPAFAVLLTDGNYNSGGNPVDIARSLSFPVFSVGVGDSIQPKDVVAKQMITAPSAYAGKKSVVRAIISAFGFGDKSAAVQLLEDGKVVDSKEVTLTNEGNIEVAFSYTPKIAGTHGLIVRVPPLKGEFDQRNNSVSASVEVMKGKYSVLLIAGEPASDVAFLRRNIESVDEFDLKVLIQKDENNFYAPVGRENASKDVNEILSQKYDALLLYDFPGPQSEGTLHQIQSILNSTPYVYFAGKNFSPEQLSHIPRIPFVVRSFDPELPGGEFQVGVSTISPGQSSAGLLPLFALLNENCDLIPPLYYQRMECTPANGAVSLAVPVLNGVRLTSPVFLVSEMGRSAAFLAYGFWRIQLMNSISGLRSDFLRDLVATLVRNLINSGRQKVLTVDTDKKSYDPSETINFNSILVDQTGSPVNDAVIDVNIRKEPTKNFVNDVQLSRNGDGSYTGNVGGLGEGRYSYYARAKSSAGFMGADSGTIVVESLNKEFIQTSMNARLLNQISFVTGGQFLTPQEFIDGRLTIKPEWTEPLTLKTENKFELLSSLPVLAAVFVLLGAEWVMRKIWGLP